MARRYFRKRYSKRRGKRTLSSYQIATKTNAKAQSRQIYALNRKVNYIQRLTRPETIIQQRLAYPTQESTTPAISFAASARGVSPLWWRNELQSDENLAIIPALTVGAGGASKNRFARLHTCSLYGNLQYNTPTTTVRPFTLRIVVVQTRATRGEAIQAADIFSNVSSVDTSRTVSVFGPLQTGLARTAKVLSDKRYNLSFQRPNVTIQTTLNYLMNYYVDSANDDSAAGNTSDSIAKGSIYVFLAWHSLGEPQDVQLSMSAKLAFTDA